MKLKFWAYHFKEFLDYLNMHNLFFDYVFFSPSFTPTIISFSDTCDQYSHRLFLVQIYKFVGYGICFAFS